MVEGAEGRSKPAGDGGERRPVLGEGGIPLRRWHVGAIGSVAELSQWEAFCGWMWLRLHCT